MRARRGAAAGTITAMATSGDYELAWPRDLLRDELSDLINSEAQKDWAVKVDLLLRDAFSTCVPAQDFASLPDEGFGRRVNALTEQRKFLASILRRLDLFPDASVRRPYWSERRTGAPAGRHVLTLESVTRNFVQIVNELDGRGYFEEAFGKDCVDDPSTISPSFLIYERIGHESMWPLDPPKLAADRD